ncbi:MAG: hypothetical protein Q8L14_11905 [Myxococcales bacterium]|nr:hypothetical protein [Myxococcales bacterium]
MRVLLIAALLVAGSAFARDPACSRSCDDLMKRMAVDCRKTGKGAEQHGGGKAEAQHAAEACQNAMKKLRVSCLKECASDQKKKR